MLFLFATACVPSGSDTAASGDDPGPVFVTVHAGTFQMGCTDGQSHCEEDEVEHTVTLTHDYLVTATEVTQAEYVAVMRQNPSSLLDCGEECPVEEVTWSDAASYANAMSRAAGLTECYACTGGGSSVTCEVAVAAEACDGDRLLTEAEWEGAARCGTDLTFAGSNTVDDVAWSDRNSDGSPHAVGGRAPNACGIYDLSGNVWEWVQDWYGEYPADAITDPTGPESGVYRVARGGGWSSEASLTRVSSRANYVYPTMVLDNIGFRIARTITAAP